MCGLVWNIKSVFFFFPSFSSLSKLALPQTRNSISSSPSNNAQSIIWRGLLNYTTFQTDELGMPLEKQSAPTTALFVSTPQPITHFMHSRNEYVPCSSSEMCRNMTLQERNSNSSFIPLCNHFVIPVKIATQFVFPLQSVSHSHIFFFFQIFFCYLPGICKSPWIYWLFRDNISLQFI